MIGRKIFLSAIASVALIMAVGAGNPPNQAYSITKHPLLVIDAMAFENVPIPPSPESSPSPSPSETVYSMHFQLDSNISWYGPGFYGNRTACGLKLTKDLVGVAHKTLKCGTIVYFKYKGVVIAAPVVDRGPYVTGRQFDMTRGLCMKLDHCFTGKIYYHIGG